MQCKFKILEKSLADFVFVCIHKMLLCGDMPKILLNSGEMPIHTHTHDSALTLKRKKSILGVCARVDIIEGAELYPFIGIN